MYVRQKYFVNLSKAIESALFSPEDEERYKELHLVYSTYIVTTPVIGEWERKPTPLIVLCGPIKYVR